MILREIDNLAPVRTADFWDNISFYFGIGQKPKEEPKTASGGIDWTTIAIIAVIAIVLVMLLKK
ncbi:MAG: hypothetical protein JG759_399 [Thermoanaerobacter sp.]|jgi:hypothetical protein|nr:hypothetical protein [Thermoanaerobacter sp.]